MDFTSLHRELFCIRPFDSRQFSYTRWNKFWQYTPRSERLKLACVCMHIYECMELHLQLEMHYASDICAHRALPSAFSLSLSLSPNPMRPLVTAVVQIVPNFREHACTSQTLWISSVERWITRITINLLLIMLQFFTSARQTIFRFYSVTHLQKFISFFDSYIKDV